MHALPELSTWLPDALVSHESHEATQEFSITSNATIEVHVARGDITIETWGKPHLLLHTAVIARTTEHIAGHRALVEHSKLKIKITGQQPSAQATMNLSLIVPATAKLNLFVTDEGKVTIKSAPRTLTIHVNHGDIAITTLTDGAIKATTDHGSITALCEAFSHESSLMLTAPYGGITLKLPPLAEARVTAQTERGSISSTLPITFDPFTAELNKSALKKLQKKVVGRLRDGDAPITLTARESITITSFEPDAS